MLMRDKIDLFTGPVGSSVALAVAPPLFAAKVPYLSSNTGPSDLAGRALQSYFFGASYPQRCVPRGGRQVRGRQGLQEGGADRTQLPRRQGRHHRLQAHLQGRHGATSSTPSWASSTTRPSSRRSAPRSPTRSTSSCRARWASAFIKQFVGAGLSKDVALISTAFSADEDMIPAGRRADARSVQHRALVLRPRQPGQPALRGRVPPAEQRPQPLVLRGPGLRRADGDGRGGARASAARWPTSPRC